MLPHRLWPDFGRLEQLLLQDCTAIQLLPHDFIENGHAVRLVPARDGVPINSKFCEVSSFPVLKLAEAGIDWDRNPDTTKAAVSALLATRKFRLWPTFSVVTISALVPILNNLLEYKAMAMEMNHRFSLGPDPSTEDIERELLSPMKELPLGFLIGADVDVPGLDLSHPVMGMVTVVPLFVMPTWGTVDPESPVGKSFVAAVQLVRMYIALKQSEDEYQAYLKKKSGKWYFLLWNWDKWYKRVIASCQDIVKERQSTFNTAMSAV